MSESEIAFPLDETIWSHVRHMEGTIAIQVTQDKMLDIMGALYDVYFAYQEDKDEGNALLIGLAALILAAPFGKAEDIWTELQVRDSMKNFEVKAREMLIDGIQQLQTEDETNGTTTGTENNTESK